MIIRTVSILIVGILCFLLIIPMWLYLFISVRLRRLWDIVSGFCCGVKLILQMVLL